MWKRTASIALLLLTLASPAVGEAGRRRGDSSVPPAPSPAGLPLSFEENRGQTDAKVRFLARPRGYRAYFTDDEAVFVLPRGSGRAADPRRRDPAPAAETDVVRMRFEGARSAPPAPGAPLPGRSNYFLGSDPAQWVIGVPHHGELLSRDLYPGIDLRWRGLPRERLEYDLVLAPGAGVEGVALQFDGAKSVALDAAGDLLVTTEGGVLRHGRPAAYQVSRGRRRHVEAAFVLGAEGRVGFRLGAGDPSLPLVIDPLVEYSTFLGGAGNDYIYGLAGDGAGSFYATGATPSTAFPTVGPIQATVSGANDVFVTKFNPAGSALVYSTYLGGLSNDQAYAVAVDGSGVATVCGGTSSADFPTFAALYPSSAGNYDGFVAKLAATGASLIYSTYVGGSSQDYARGLALASDGGAVVCGSSASTQFPTTASALQKTNAGGEDAFVLRMSPAGDSLAWSTYLGGSNSDAAYGVGLDSTGRPVLAGYTISANFPSLNGAQATLAGDSDAFVSKVAADGSALVWSTFYGGTGPDFSLAMGVGPDNRAWITGSTTSTNLPLAGAFQTAPGGQGDAFVLRLSEGGTVFQMSTYLGGSGKDTGYALVVNGDGGAVVAGTTESQDFPMQVPVQANKGLLGDIFLATFQAAQSTPDFSTFIGGNGDERGVALAVDSRGRIAVGGNSNGASNTYPLLNAFDSTLSGSSDAVLTVVKALPYAPSNVSAALAGLTTIEVLWDDPGTEETGIRVERATDGVSFQTMATTAPDVTAYLDQGLDPGTTYTYRVRTVVGSYKSAPSVEVAVTTPPTPVVAPAAPTDLQAVVVSPRRVDLTWVDNSDNEDFFVLSRALGTGLFATLATPRLGATSRTDATPLPGRTYSYKVRAANPTGPSFDTNVEVVTMPSTMEVGLLKGVVSDRDGFGKDSVKCSGTMSYGPDAEHEAFDPAVQSLSMRLSGIDGPALVDIAAASPGWTLKKGKWTWRSPKGSFSKAKVVVEPESGAWSATITRMTLPAAMANPQRITLTAGTDEGHLDADWTLPNGKGVVRYPVPAPR